MRFVVVEQEFAEYVVALNTDRNKSISAGNQRPIPEYRSEDAREQCICCWGKDSQVGCSCNYDVYCGTKIERKAVDSSQFRC